MNPSQSNSNLASSSSTNNCLVDAWYQKKWWLWLLTPLSLLFYTLSLIRRLLLRNPLTKKTQLTVPVIVVGNISVGGTGKTPLIIALCDYLKQQGFSPGVISRGYGSSAPYYPFVVTDKTSVNESGDEPLMIAIATQCPVVIDRDRCSAAKKIIEQCHVDVILSDDGLQHYRLPRDIEIVVVDSTRGFGNGLLLPAGPLRETKHRLKTVDFVISNENSTASNTEGPSQSSIGNNISVMRIVPEYWCHLDSAQRKVSIESQLFCDEEVNAVSGIGNPQRFYSTLEMLGIKYQPKTFPDHHQYTSKDLIFDDKQSIVVMTEKDAVKARRVIPESNNIYWYLAVTAKLSPMFLMKLLEKLNHVIAQK
ncbi:MAG: tetraacyldisaccharide 4'-kinase [Cellvibrionaceae bacterium]